MVALIDFSSVLQLSAAVHLATGVFLEVRSNFLGRYRDHLDYAKQTVVPRIQRREVDSEKLETAIALFESAWLVAFFAVKPWIRKLTYLSLIIACYSVGWLIVAGFSNGLELDELYMAQILAVDILPLPVSLLALWLKMRTYRASLEDAANRLEAETNAALGQSEARRTNTK